MSLKSRACFACYGIGALFTALSGRLIHLGVTQHDRYAQKAAENYRAKLVIPARRGCILDAEGTCLARNEPLRNIILDGSLIHDPEKAAALLAAPLKISNQNVLGKISPSRRYVVLKKKVPETVALSIDKAAQAAGIRGITFENNFERIYPAGEMLCHIVGFFGFDKNDPKTPGGSFRGIEGVERSMDDWLAGQEGWRRFEKDGRGRELPSYASEEHTPRHGADVRLTVNLSLQQIVESELEKACKRLRPLRASVIMMKPDTGEILALANRPAFDPNEPSKVSREEMPRRKMTDAEIETEANRIASTRRFNYAVAGTYEPGSTFKAITCAGAINSHLVKPGSEVWCENGKWSYGGAVLKDHHPYGMLKVSEIIEKSSNIGAAKLGVQMGDDRLYGWVRAFGFGQHTGIALPGEVRGKIRPTSEWQPMSVTRIAMGHEVGVTPLQVTTATCVIANGGRLFMPKLIHHIRDEDGTVRAFYEPQEIRRVITEDTAAKVRDALIKVTGKKGTAKLAHIPGFRVAGKTGTAQKVEDGHYSHEHHITSFVGFVPAEKPAFCMLVLFDQAEVKAHEDVGGLVAAPVFRAIAERSLAYLGVEPDPALLQQEKEGKEEKEEKAGNSKRTTIAKSGRN